MRQICLLFLLTTLFNSFIVFAYDDTTAYSNLIIGLRDLSLEQHLAAIEDYLEKNPNSLYKTEIEHNIAALQKLVEKETLPEQESQKAKDTELFFKAQGLAKTLPLAEKIQLWQQFIHENPHSIYLKDAKYNLNKLQERKNALDPQNSINTSIAQSQETLVAKKLPYKDPKKAMTLATTAGLVVPGMGHWYTEDYIPAGIFAGLRVVGIGLFTKGYYDNSRSTQVTGFLIGLFSYIADIADAPFSVERYNDRVDKEMQNQVLNFNQSQDYPTHNFVFSFKF
ncbi:MAG TPA: hypothetical protein PKC21_05435 [Oligoflexia bacterium]|nr:hypothetical protein [Oligoflexia bacterium]HMR24778.1 hypothetical protein [Oligoflexia bacterium]